MKILVSGAGMLGCNLARNFMMKAEQKSRMAGAGKGLRRVSGEIIRKFRGMQYVI